MKKYAFIIDIGLCENCNNCFLACKDEHCGNDWPGYSRPQPLHGHRWLDIRQKERGSFPTIDVAYLPRPCMHCDGAPCVAAGGGAVAQRSDGIVLIDPTKARGQRALLDACPYGAIWWNEEEDLPQKCTLCAHLLDDGWPAPRCVQACPTGALTLFAGDDRQLQEKVKNEGLELLPEAENQRGRPRCYYRNLYRFSRCFIAGSIAERPGGIEECVVAARVILRQGERIVAEQLSDDFGDFKFDDLAEDGADYQLEIAAAGKLLHLGVPALTGSRVLGTILLD
jgi:Fe-S-cluster-containing dehydrogenase component